MKLITKNKRIIMTACILLLISLAFVYVFSEAANVPFTNKAMSWFGITVLYYLATTNFQDLRLAYFTRKPSNKAAYSAISWIILAGLFLDAVFREDSVFLSELLIITIVTVCGIFAFTNAHVKDYNDKQN